MNTEPNDLPVASSEDDREAAWERHVAEVAPWRADHRDRDIAARGQAYRAGFDAGWSACRSPVSPPEDVTALLAEHDALRYDLANKPGPEVGGGVRRVLSMLDRLVAALRAPLPVETVATEDEACARDDGTVYVDRRNDVFVKVGARAFELAGHTGRLGPTWIAYPARVFRPTREEGDRG